MADVAVPGVSTVGVRLGYAADMETFTAPESVTLLTRISEADDVALDTEQLDASALEDFISKYIAGRQDTGGEWPVTINITNETITEWEAIKGTKKAFEIYSPNLTKGFWVRAQVPAVIPSGSWGQNEVKTASITLTLMDVFGWQTKVTPSA